MPDYEEDVTWEWIKEALPSLAETVALYDLVNILAKPSLCTLTKLESPDPLYEDIHRVFKNELYKLSYSIKMRNSDYDYLDPDNIACSIDI